MSRLHKEEQQWHLYSKSWSCFFQRKDVGLPNILQLKKGHVCLADPGFKVCFGSALCVNDAAQICEMADLLSCRFHSRCETVLVELLFRLRIFSRGRDECSATILVFSCICLWVRDMRAKSSSKIQIVQLWLGCPSHSISFFVTWIISQSSRSIARRNKKGDCKQSYLTPVRKNE